MSEIADKVKAIVVEQLGVAEDQVTPEAKFVEDLGADSLDQVELVMALEEEFGADIPDEEAEKLTTVGDAIAYVESKSNWFSHPMWKIALRAGRFQQYVVVRRHAVYMQFRVTDRDSIGGPLLFYNSK